MVKIIGMDESQTDFSKSTNKVLHDIYFTLDEEIDSKLAKMIEDEHRVFRTLNWRRIKVTNTHIVILSTPLDEAEIQLEHIKKDLEEALVKYKQYLESENQKKQLEEEAEKEQQQNISDVAKKLKFD